MIRYSLKPPFKGLLVGRSRFGSMLHLASISLIMLSCGHNDPSPTRHTRPMLARRLESADNYKYIRLRIRPIKVEGGRELIVPWHGYTSQEFVTEDRKDIEYVVSQIDELTTSKRLDLRSTNTWCKDELEFRGFEPNRSRLLRFDVLKDERILGPRFLKVLERLAVKRNIK